MNELVHQSRAEQSRGGEKRAKKLSRMIQRRVKAIMESTAFEPQSAILTRIFMQSKAGKKERKRKKKKKEKRKAKPTPHPH